MGEEHKSYSEQAYNKLIDNMVNNLDIEELMNLGRQITEKYEMKDELYEFFHRQIVYVEADDNVNSSTTSAG